MTDGPRVEAIDRALTLLSALANAGADGAALAELASATGVNKSTAYRALSTMKHRGFVAQSENTGEYHLGPVAMTLGEGFLTPQSLAQSLHPAVLALSREANELVHLGMLIGDQVLYIDKVEPERPIRVWSEVGRRTPAATCAMGRALLAARGVPDDQLDAYLKRSALTLVELTKQVHLTRSRGFAIEFEENEPGVACLGVAIVRDSRVVAAVSITMLAERMTPARQDELFGLARNVLPPMLPAGLSLAAA